MKLTVVVKNGAGLAVESPQSLENRIKSKDQRLSQKFRKHKKFNA
jgi:hypothetical protein